MESPPSSMERLTGELRPIYERKLKRLFLDDMEAVDTSLTPRMITGVEDLHDLTNEALWKILGVPKDGIPYMASHIDISGQGRNAATHKTEWSRLCKASKDLMPFRLRRSQLIALTRMVQQFFKGDSTCLFDAVGGGKTIIILAFIAMLRANRDAKKKSGNFLGAFRGFHDLLSIFIAHGYQRRV
jgi:hypothetical protein